jgi:MFS family permease
VREQLPQVTPFLRVGGREFRVPDALRALRHRAYRLFFAGQLVSLTGSWMQSTAQQWLVYRLTGSPLKLGTIMVASTLPVMLLSLPAGVLVDRVDKRKLLLVLQVAQMLTAAFLAGLVLTDRVEYEHVLGLAFVFGLANAFDMPARQSFTIEMVGREDLMNAVALNSSVFNGARLAGPVVAGLLIQRWGEGPAIAANAVSFLAVIGALLAMRLPAGEPRPPRKHPWAEMKEGVAYILASRDVLQIGAMATISSIFGFSFTTLMPVIARERLGLEADGFGMLVAALGLGALVGALSLAAMGHAESRRWLLTIARLVFCAAAFTIAASPWVALTALAMGVAGWGLITNLALSNTLVQLAVPDALRGRVMAAYVWGVVGSAPIGSLFMGATAEAWGAAAAIALGASACLVAAIGAEIVRARSVRAAGS